MSENGEIYTAGKSDGIDKFHLCTVGGKGFLACFQDCTSSKEKENSTSDDSSSDEKKEQLACWCQDESSSGRI